MKPKPLRTVGGWSDEARRIELERLIDIAQHRYDWTRTEVLRAIANRFMVEVNTVQGWASKPRVEVDNPTAKATPSRKPPSWMVIDILRTELGEAEVLGLAAYAPGALSPGRLSDVLHAPKESDAGQLRRHQ